MRQPVFALLFLLNAALPAQHPAPNTPVKGAAPLETHHSTLIAHHSIRAVVIGITDYQSPQTPDLRFAHRDAEAFADWLKSPAGGSVPEDNIRLLTDAQATNAAIIYALFELLDSCRAGDQVFVYFSGHGDVENKLRNQPGFLLAHDSPPRVYASNAVGLRELNDIVATLAEQQVRVVLVTDACHAGKLAGSDSGGSQTTALALQQQFAHAVKVMSCQPNEFSLEGEQWGDGRGVFSFHLLDEVQQALNALLADDPHEANNWRYNPDKYDRYPEYLQRAMDLLGERHHLQRALLSKKRYFEGYLFARKIVSMSAAAVRDSLREVAKNKYLEAAALEPGAPYVYHAIGSLYFVNNPSRTDSMRFWMEKAIELAPTWQLPYLDQGAGSLSSVF